MSDTTNVHDYLRDAHVPYTVVRHRPAFSAQEEAAVAHVPGRDWAKVVICFVDQQPVQAVLPAPYTVNLPLLLELTGGADIRLAQQDELLELFPECEPGAMPPFGPMYGQSVFVDVTLAGEPEIVFNAGRHTEAICMRWAHYVSTVRPIVGRFAEPRSDHVGAFRLSFRE